MAIYSIKKNVTIENKTLTVATGATTGTATFSARTLKLVGITPLTNQDQFIKNFSWSTDRKTITVTLLAAATADNVFDVVAFLDI